MDWFEEALFKKEYFIYLEKHNQIAKTDRK